MKLSEAVVGSRVRVRGVYFPQSIQNKILSLGFVPGTVVEVVRSAPLGDPRVYKVRGKLITLRNDEASFVEVEPVDRFIPLSMATVGKTYRIVSFQGGRSFISKMSSLGLREGARIKIVEKRPVIIELDGRVLRIGTGMADRIIVEEI